MLEVMEDTELVLNEIVADDSVFQFAKIHIDISTLIAAAGKELEQYEDGESCDQENGNLQQVDNQIVVQASLPTAVSAVQ